MAADGAVVVDSSRSRAKVYGIADGHGFLKAAAALAPQERARARGHRAVCILGGLVRLNMARAKTVMILGASRYYLRSIEATRRCGYRVVAVDRNPAAAGLAAADCGEACDIMDAPGVLRLARSHRIDGIVPVNDYGVPTAALVAEALGLPGISPAAAELATSKEAMRRRWLEAGVPGPRFLVRDYAAAAREAIRRIGLPCILKPAHGIGGASRGVIVVRAAEEIDAALAFTHRFYEDKTTLVEQFIAAPLEHGAEVLIWQGTPHVIAIADKIKSPLPYRVDRNVLYPTSIQGEQLAALRRVIAQAVLALDIRTGAAHVELASVNGGFMLFELGARCGGGGTPEPIVPYVTGIEELSRRSASCVAMRRRPSSRPAAVAATITSSPWRPAECRRSTGSARW